MKKTIIKLDLAAVTLYLFKVAHQFTILYNWLQMHAYMNIFSWFHSESKQQQQQQQQLQLRTTSYLSVFNLSNNICIVHILLIFGYLFILHGAKESNFQN